MLQWSYTWHQEHACNGVSLWLQVHCPASDRNCIMWPQSFTMNHECICTLSMHGQHVTKLKPLVMCITIYTIYYCVGTWSETSHVRVQTVTTNLIQLLVYIFFTH